MDPLYDDSKTTLAINLKHLPWRSLVEFARFFAQLANVAVERATEIAERERREARITEEQRRIEAAGRGQLIDDTIPPATVDANMRVYRRGRRRT